MVDCGALICHLQDCRMDLPHGSGLLSIELDIALAGNTEENVEAVFQIRDGAPQLVLRDHMQAKLDPLGLM